MASTADKPAAAAGGTLAESFRVSRTISSFYTGGRILYGAGSGKVYSLCSEGVSVVDPSSGEVECELDVENDGITTFAVHDTNDATLRRAGAQSSGGGEVVAMIVTAGRSQLLRHWLITTRTTPDASGQKLQAQLLRSWASSQSVVTCMDFDSSGGLLVTGGVDNSVKVWDIPGYFCTHHLRGHNAPVSHVRFLPNQARVASVGDDFEIRVWDLVQAAAAGGRKGGPQCQMILRDHQSSITALEIGGPHGETLISAGKDQMINFWDVTAKKEDEGRREITRKPAHLLPVFEAVHAMCLLPNKLLAVVGEEGTVKLWDPIRRHCFDEKKASDFGVTGNFIHTFWISSMGEEGHLCTVGEDRTLTLWRAEVTEGDQPQRYHDARLEWHRQIMGDLDEVVSTKWIGKDRVIASFNDSNPRVVSGFSADPKSQISTVPLPGHEGTVLTIAVAGPGGKHGREAEALYALTGSKDQTARLWSLKTNKCLAVLKGHTGAVTGVALSRRRPGKAFTCSEDKTVKMWDIASVLGEGSAEGPVEITSAAATVVAHLKSANDVQCAPNDKLIASAGQDKLIKVWRVDAAGSLQHLELAGTCTGHRRGVWGVDFSPVDKVLASASGDSLVKLWNLVDYTCIRTFQGHEHAVLNVSFIGALGMQLVSSGGDGLVRLWHIRTSECAAVLEGHDDRVWSMDANASSSCLVTGGADSKLLLWEDCTSEEKEKAQQASAEAAQRDTRIQMLLLQGKHKEALDLALKLRRPGLMKTVLEDHAWKSLTLAMEGEETDKDLDIGTWVEGLKEDDLEALVDVCGRWQTTARNCDLAHSVMNEVFKRIPASRLYRMEGIASFLDSFVAYGAKHLRRLEAHTSRAFLCDGILASVGSTNVLPELSERRMIDIITDDPKEPSAKRQRGGSGAEKVAAS
ncbi:Transducin (beta)-like 3 [Perkinsus olseni]|uniref:Transducin (Beta)-like 3 n=1 Tax=Perkinsus olseni TaxID=32597 RepID=A0A7J6MAG8_PEROL|nr:Transducin (beta)-like 3 [Perkinsus olseni]